MMAIVMMNYPKPNSHLRVNYLKDEAAAINEYVWFSNTNIGQSKKFFTTAHRSILHITKSKDKTKLMYLKIIKIRGR